MRRKEAEQPKLGHEDHAPSERRLPPEVQGDRMNVNRAVFGHITEIREGDDDLTPEVGDDQAVIGHRNLLQRGTHSVKKRCRLRR